tara:strand:+ start:358 stop:708 length:351 start_codon:yes stop_codon:yes gene_type:complete
MKTDSRTVKILLLTIAAMLTLGIGAVNSRAVEKEESKLKFPTQSIREMWWACSLEFKKIMPTIQENTKVYLCDCYTDEMRKTFTPEQVKAMTKEQSRTLGIMMRQKCPIPRPVIQT